MRKIHAFSGAAVAAVFLLTASAASAQAAPAASCQADPNFRLQDFSVGTWDVYNKDKRTAEAKLEWALNGCTIVETWTPTDPASKGHGMGHFTYSKLLKSWHYFWVSDTGSTTYFKGELIKPGEMRYVTTARTASGGERLRHWTLFAQPDGGVRELSVATEDGGKTWTTEYDLYWRKQK